MEIGTILWRRAVRLCDMIMQSLAVVLSGHTLPLHKPSRWGDVLRSLPSAKREYCHPSAYKEQVLQSCRKKQKNDPKSFEIIF